MAAEAAIAACVGDFYESHPYPPPVDDVEAYRRRWDDHRRRCDAHLFWPADAYRDDRSIFVAGCGTVQAVHYALRWPRARVVGIDVSARSIAFAQELKEKYALENLELHQLPVERAGDLRGPFEYVVCTGVLHHLPDPPAGLQALREALHPAGALHLMVYAPYGRAGVYMLQEYCRRLGIGFSDDDIRDLAASMKALPEDHPIVPLLRKSPDFANVDALADALLHPLDRAYSVSQLVELLSDAGLTFGRWVRQAPYLAACGALASTPHAQLLTQLPAWDQYAAVELFRGTMVRHSAVVYHNEANAARHSVDFGDDAWLQYVPLRLPETIAVRERLPSGASAVLINRNHTDRDLYLPIDGPQERLLAAIDGQRSLAQICRELGNRDFARTFFERLWQWDQIVFDTSKVALPNAAKNGKA